MTSRIDVSMVDGAATAEQGTKADTALQPDDIGVTEGTVAAGNDSRIVNALQGPDLGYPLAQLGLPVLHVSGEWDWTAVINTALAAGKRILLPEGTTGVTGIIVKEFSTILGVHRQNAILKLLNGSNKHIISTLDFDTKFNTADTEIAPKGIRLHNFTINGNRANNTVGCGIALYARLFSIVNIDLYSIADDGIKCDYRDTASGPITPGGYGMLGMESEFRWIGMDDIGGHGMDMAGPHDSFLENVHIIHASQKADNTYDPFHFRQTFSCRGINLHCYNSGLVNNHRYGIWDDAGCDITNSHFEGAAGANVYINRQRSIYRGIRAYATRNTSRNVIIASNENYFSGQLGGKASGINCIGVTLGLSGSDFPQSNIIDVIAIEQNAATVDFTYSQGYNDIRVRGEQSIGGVNLSNPHVTDKVDIVLGTKSVKQAGNKEGNNVTAAGTNATDATVLTAKANRITGASGNMGVKLPSTVFLVGETITIINSTANTIKVYAETGDSIEYPGNAFPVPFNLAANKTVMFTSCYRGQWAGLVTA